VTEVDKPGEPEVAKPAASEAKIGEPATLAIRLSGIARRLGREAVLRSIDIEIAPGRVVVLRGSNGAGKTTLLRLIATRLRPSHGDGAVFGHDLVREADAVRGHIGMLGTMGGNYPLLSAKENLALALDLAGKQGSQHVVDALRTVGVEGVGERNGRGLDDALRTVGLEGVGDKLVRTYSSGMKKRLGLARQLLLDPDLWLLDEPHAALDEDGKALIDRCVMAARERGRTVLMSSHESERHGLTPDAEVVLEQGVLRRVGAGQRAPTGSLAS